MGRFRAGWVLAMLLLCGCAPTMVATEKIAAIRRVAVISAIGDTFTVRNVGVTVFGNDHKTFPIDAWGIDPFVVNRVRSVLAGRFEVRTFAYQRAAFDTTGNNFDKIADAVRAQATSTDIDAYIVVSKGGSRYGSTNQSVYGLGIVQGSGLGSAVVAVYALYWITVVDGHSFAVVANSPAFPLDQTMLSFEAIKGPSRKVDESWMPTTLDATQNMRLKSAVTELLDRHLPGTIESLKLLQ
jgi:uncharacterized membrane protein